MSARSALNCNRAGPKRGLKDVIHDYATDLRDFAGDFEVELADMFDPEQEITYDDPEDSGIGAEIHRLIGWIECAAIVLDSEPAALVAEYAETEGAAEGAH